MPGGTIFYALDCLECSVFGVVGCRRRTKGAWVVSKYGGGELCYGC